VAGSESIATVRDLISRLSEFDPDAPIRAQHAVVGTPDFVVGVGESPDQPGVVAVIYLPPVDASI